MVDEIRNGISLENDKKTKRDKLGEIEERQKLK